MRKIAIFIVVAVTILTAVIATSCQTGIGCYKVEGVKNGKNGVWYESGTRMSVELECIDEDITNYTISKTSEYTIDSCPDNLD